MGVDIIFFAVVAIVLIWKLVNVINNKEQSFLSKTTEGYANSGANQAAGQGNGVLQAIGIGNKNKPTKESLDAILTFEKLQIDQSLHNVYDSVFEANPYVTPSSTCQIAKQMYEEVLQAFKTKVLASSYTISPEMMNILNEKLGRLKHSVMLMKIDSAKVTDISFSGKDVTFVVEIVSQQIVYREDENGVVVEGSKAASVAVKEHLHIIRPVNNQDAATLKAITL
jgi:predicted lipid-binding transport protein (Tim44 family)